MQNALENLKIYRKKDNIAISLMGYANSFCVKKAVESALTAREEAKKAILSLTAGGIIELESCGYGGEVEEILNDIFNKERN